MPVFSARVSHAGANALVMFELDLPDVPVADVLMVKVLSEERYKLFEQVFSADDLDDGRSVVVASDRRTIRGSGERTAAGDYIAFVIKDDGEYDMDRRPLHIMDPTFVTVRAAQPTPGPTVEPTPGHVGSGGGCVVGAFGFPVALILLLPAGLLLLGRGK